MRRQAVQLAVSDYGELGALERFLRLAAPEAEVLRLPGQPGAGQQGELDLLTLLGTSPVIIAAIRMLPRFLEARKPGLSVRVKVKNTDVEISGASIDEVMRVLDKALDD
ncbi:MAG: effector-associated constant component EACC1 [Streptosporangiaceae bacterium]